MDIESFTLTLALGLLSGLLLGVFGREIFRATAAVFLRIYSTPKYLQPYRKPEQTNDTDRESV